VTVDSAKWGHFKKTFASSGRRGISHGDMIDLKREDYKGFDVIEAYVQIVAELKEMGF
jgi:triacylglycerol lipase